MTTDWALIDNALVVNVAVAGDPVDAGWLAAVRAQYDAVIDITGYNPRPGIGWTYENGTFTPPPPPPDPEP